MTCSDAPGITHATAITVLKVSSINSPSNMLGELWGAEPLKKLPKDVLGMGRPGNSLEPKHDKSN